MKKKKKKSHKNNCKIHIDMEEIKTSVIQIIKHKIENLPISPQNPDIYSPDEKVFDAPLISPQNPAAFYKPFIGDKSTKELKNGKLVSFDKIKFPFEVSPQNPMYNPVKCVSEEISPAKLEHLMLEITSKCDFKCKHCYCNSNNHKYRNLKLKEINALIREFREEGGKSVTLTGGEPKLHPEFWGIMELLNQNKIESSIFTNGFHWNLEDIQRIKNLNLKTLQVSVDGIYDTHDNFRGVNGSYQKAIETLKIAKDNSLNTVMMITIHQNNIHEIPELLEIAKKIKVDSVNLNTYMPQGRAKRLPTPNLDDLKSIYENIEINVCPSSSTTSCGIGFKKIAILSNGDIVPCEVLNNLVVGNINKDNIFEVFRKSSIMEEIRNSTVENIEQCRTCSVKNVCKGGCKASAWLNSQSFFAPDERQCSIWKK